MFCDIQATEPEIKVSLTRVGVVNLKKLVKIHRRNKRPIILLPTFEVFVDLPSSQKGIHMSRSPEVIEEVIEKLVVRETYGIEELSVNIVKKLFERHEYASRAEVLIYGDYILEERSPITAKPSQGVCKIIGRAYGIKDEKGNIHIKKMVGAEVVGITACPCAQNLLKEKTVENLKKKGFSEEDIEKILDAVVVATHNQRGIGTVMIEVPEGYNVSIRKIIEIIRKSMSGEVYELLKRADEAYVVEKAHRNPKFVEDCAREMIKRIVEEFDYLPDDTQVLVRQVNKESIHRHDAFAERRSTMGELRRELNSR
ncbi:MAG TPA: GTP cyclohydrolase I FolE2 [Methanothermococcus okinawensis]|uniref:GTP cyclohydrolase MptA n=1 Tax=Methanothermococcus okinawensis TaxID=155863 RepID=A0A832ZB32_9EURY|nr:GTP cyclohydrolase I FolE2 [Methanothermococcus okinawensis]HIP91363.1 GTP cyclohydrolase I FolE2 [Methanothermococcus okinawensis]